MDKRRRWSGGRRRKLVGGQEQASVWVPGARGESRFYARTRGGVYAVLRRLRRKFKFDMAAGLRATIEVPFLWVINAGFRGWAMKVKWVCVFNVSDGCGYKRHFFRIFF